MNYLLIITLFLKLSTLVALAQQPVPSSLRTRITDDGQTLSIQFDGFKSNRKMHYDQHFDVSNMSGLQKEIIKYRAFSTAGVRLPLHEMSWLITTLLGFLVLISVLWVMGSQAKKMAPAHPV